MKSNEIDLFEKSVVQTNTFYDEISLLAKKAPNAAINKFKLKFINQCLDTVNNIIGDLKPFSDFTLFDEDELPFNSDVVLILAHYKKSLSNFFYKTTKLIGNTRYWITEDGEERIEAKLPLELKRIYQ